MRAIYEFFPADARGPSFSAQRCAQAEYAHEVASVFALPSTIARIREVPALGLQIAFVSNTYYSQDQVAALLRGAGIPDACLTAVFCSSDYGRGKQHGLFADVLVALGVPAEGLVHCGDNDGTDVAAPSKLGIRTSPYRSSLRLWLQHASEGHPECIADAVRTANRYSPVTDPLRDFGSTFLGPIVAGFIGWLLDVAAREERSVLLFAEREGVFFQVAVDLVLQRLYARSPGPVRTDRIAVSRRSVMPLTVGSAEHLDLQTDLFRRRLAFGLFDTESYSAPESVARTRAYLNAKLDDPANTILVDIGYKGTISHILNGFLVNGARRPLLGAYLITTDAANRDSSPAVGFLPGPDSSVNVLARSQRGICFLEQCFMPALGSVAGYDEKGEPIRQESLLSEQQIAEQFAVQEGVLAYLSDLVEVCERFGLPLSAASMSQSKATEEIVSLLSTPTSATEDLSAAWEHEVNFGSNRRVPVSAKPLAAITGPALDLLLRGKSWTGPLHRDMPLSLSAPTVARTSFHLSCTSDRGPFGPGKVEVRYLPSDPRVARVLEMPLGERLLTLRITRDESRAPIRRIRLAVPRVPCGGGEHVSSFDDVVWIVVQYSGTQWQVVGDSEQLVIGFESDGDALRLLFGQRLTAPEILLLVDLAVPSVGARLSTSTAMLVQRSKVWGVHHLPNWAREALRPAVRRYRRWLRSRA